MHAGAKNGPHTKNAKDQPEQHNFAAIFLYYHTT
jgi:hypothetical protein